LRCLRANWIQLLCTSHRLLRTLPKPSHPDALPLRSPNQRLQSFHVAGTTFCAIPLRWPQDLSYLLIPVNYLRIDGGLTLYLFIQHIHISSRMKINSKLASYTQSCIKQEKIHRNIVNFSLLILQTITDSTYPMHSAAGVRTLSCRLLGLYTLSCRAFSYSTMQRHTFHFDSST